MKFKHKPLVVGKYRFWLFLFNTPVILFWTYLCNVAMVLEYGTLATIFIVSLLIYLGLRLPPQYTIYPDGIHFYKFTYSQFVSWDEITFIYIPERLSPFHREIIIGSHKFPRWRALLGYSLLHRCPKYYLSYGVHRNVDKAWEVLEGQIKAVKANAKVKS